MTKCCTKGLPCFGQRLRAAVWTSIGGSVVSWLFMFIAFTVMPMSFVKAIGETASNIILFGFTFILTGLACLAVNRKSLHLNWLGTAVAMISPYLLVLTVPLACGLVHLSFSRNSYSFAHTWFLLYIMPAWGAAGPAAVAAALRLGYRVLGSRRTEDTRLVG